MNRSYKILRAAVSIVAAFSLCISCVNAAQESEPLLSVPVEIYNSGFEDTVYDFAAGGNIPYNWTCYAGGEQCSGGLVSSYDALSGSYAAQLTKNDSGEFYIESDGSAGAWDGAMYSFGAYVKTENAEDCKVYIRLRVTYSDGSYEDTCSDELSGNIYSYQKISGTVGMRSDVASIRIAAVITDASEESCSYNEAVLYVDDVFFVRHTPYLRANDENFGFESVTSEDGTAYPMGWRVSGEDSLGFSGEPPAFYASDSESQGGSYSLYIGKPVGSKTLCAESMTAVSVTGGERYEWGMMCKGSGGVRADLRVYSADGALIDTLKGGEYTVSSNEWVSVSVFAQLPSSAAKVSPVITVLSGEAQLFADAVFINKYVIKGDISGNGTLDSDDIVLLKRALLGIDKKGDSHDVNGDGSADILDLIYLKKRLAGNIA